MLVPFHINVSGKTVLGMAHLPLRAMIGTPVLILCYGLNGNRIECNKMLVNLGNALAQNGIALIRFDYRGLGISDGDFCEIDLQTKVEDIKCITDYVTNIYEGDNPSIILVGFSDGIKQILSFINNDLLVPVKGILMLNPVIWSSNIDEPIPFSNKVQFIRHPRNGKIVANKLGNFFSIPYLRQLSQEPKFDFNQIRTALFYSAYDTISENTRVKLCNILPDSPAFIINSNDHVFSEEQAQNELSKAIIKLVQSWMKGEQ